MIRWQKLLGGTLALLAVGLAVSPANATGTVKPAPDFNGDGFDDLVVGVPGEDFESYSNPTTVNAGIVQVIYGSPSGLEGATNKLISRRRNHPMIARANANLGASIAWGDFNGDGFDDLAIGAPGDDSGKGNIEVWLGSANGLTQPNLLLSRQNVEGVAGQPSERFGDRLAVGDVDGDGFDDLAISRSNTRSSRGNLLGRGVISILRGSSTGLRYSAPQTLNYNIIGPNGMTFGDFNGDGHDDLAMGYPYLGTGGQVWIGFGTPYGIDSNPRIITQSTLEAGSGVPESGDQFGYSLAAGDILNNGKADLVVGAPGEDGGKGVVHVVWLSTGASGQIWSQDAPGVFEVAEVGDRFGESVAIAHLYREGASHTFAEVVIGVPGEDGGKGAIQIVGPVGGGQLNYYTQDGYNIRGAAAVGDRFGTSLAIGDYNGDGYSDMAIGVPGDIGTAGVINVIFGTYSAPSWPGNEILTQGVQGLADSAEATDGFGSIL